MLFKSMLSSFVFGMTVMGCGDIIKAPNPFKRGSHEKRDSFTGSDQSACPNLRGLYRGECSELIPSRVEIAVDQLLCDDFSLSSGLSFSTTREQSVTVNTNSYTTKASWNSDRSTLELKVLDTSSKLSESYQLTQDKLVWRHTKDAMSYDCVLTRYRAQ